MLAVGRRLSVVAVGADCCLLVLVDFDGCWLLGMSVGSRSPICAISRFRCCLLLRVSRRCVPDVSRRGGLLEVLVKRNGRARVGVGWNRVVSAGDAEHMQECFFFRGGSHWVATGHASSPKVSR